MKKTLALLLMIMLLCPVAAMADVPAFGDIAFPPTSPSGIFMDAASLDYSYDDMTERYSVELMTTNYGSPKLPDDNDPILRYLSDKFNLDITFTTVLSADLESTISTRFAADDAPDITSVPTRDLAFTLSDAGLLVDAKELYPYLPLHQKYTTQGMIDYSTNQNGEIAFVTKYGIQDGVWCIAIREDWLKALNMEMPKTKQELIDFAVAVTTQDPDGNGVADTYFMTAAGNGRALGMLENAFSTMAGPNEAHPGEDGVLSHPYFNGARKEFLSFVKELYDLNVLAPDWYVIDWETAKSYTLNDKIGMVYYPAGSLYLEYTSAQGNYQQATVDAWKFMDQYPVEGGKYDKAGNPGYMWAFSKSGFAGQDGKLKRVLHLFDTMAVGGENFSHTAQSADDAVYEAFGLELKGHQEFVYTDDGMFYIHMTGQDENGARQFPYDDNSYGGLNLASWQNFGLNVSWQLTDPDQPTEEMGYYAKKTNEGIVTIAGVDRWTNYGLNISLTGAAAEASVTLRDWIYAQEYEFVTGARSLDEYEAFTAEWLSKGGAEIIRQSATSLGCEVPDYAK